MQRLKSAGMHRVPRTADNGDERDWSGSVRRLAQTGLKGQKCDKMSQRVVRAEEAAAAGLQAQQLQ